jgi:hypothetical protein
VRPEDREGRPWFTVPNNTVSSAVRLNLRGREPRGVVDPAARDQVCTSLALHLAELVDLDTGRPVVTAVVRAEDLYGSDVDDRFPDLLVEWRHDTPVEQVWSPRVGALDVPYGHWRTGDHRGGGLLAVRAAGLAPGRRAGAVGLERVAPTLAGLLGLTLPDVDGAPVADLLPGGGDEVGATPATAEPAPEDVVAAASTRWRTSTRATEPIRRQLSLRLQALLDLPALEQRRQHADRRLDALEAHQDVLGEAVARVEDAAHRALDRAVEVGAAAAEAGRRIHEASGGLQHLARYAEGVAAQVGLHDERLGHLYRLAEIDTTMRWVELADVPPSLNVSVVTATWNRSDVLGRAIGSVLAQAYPRWELLVADDGSTDDTAAVVARLGDPRIRHLPGGHAGANASRNRALDAATGDVVVYLDDDNVMHPLWLKALVWAFTQRPEVRVAYGARVIDDVERVHDRTRSGGMPWVQFEPWDRAKLERGNFADMGVIAHRPRPDIRFDPSIVAFGDWDVFLRLTADERPLELPVVAIGYTTGRADALTLAEGPGEVSYIRAKASGTEGVGS